MRLFKMFGLAMLAATAVMAFAGVGTAAAVEQHVVLCDAHPNAAGECTEANIYPENTNITSQLKEATKAELKIENTGTVKCQKSAVAGKTLEKLGSPQLHGEITSLTFEECHLITVFGESQCTATAVQLPYRALLQQDKTKEGLEKGNGHLFVYEKEKGSGQPGAIVECGTIFGLPTINCEYKVAEKEETQLPGIEEGQLQVLGGEPDFVVANQVTLKSVKIAGHETCPSGTPLWSATYELHEPKQGGVQKAWVGHILV